MRDNKGYNLICKFRHSLRTSSNSADFGGSINICHCIFVLLAAAAIILTAAEAGMALNSDDSLDNAGPIVDATDVIINTGWIDFTANELPMFYLDLDEVNFDPDNNQGESLTIQLIAEDEIADDGIIYTSRAWTDENGRMNIAWLGEKYLAVGQDPSKLAKYLVDFKSYESLALEKGDVWDMGEGFTLNFTDIDVNGENVSLVLEKYGTTVAGLIASAGETVYYYTTVANVSDVTVARIHVDKIFADTNMIIIDEVQIISLDVTELNQTKYFEMEFSSTANSLMLTETDGITSIHRGMTVEIIPDFLGIRVGDTQYPEPVRLYVFSEITPQELYKQHGPLINSTAEAPGSIILNANELPMFYKDLDEIDFNPESNKGESLTINLIEEDEIANYGIIYTSRAWTDENGRTNIAWLGEKYLAVGDYPSKLAKYLVDFNSSENITLGLGDVRDIGESFALNFTDIDVNGENVSLVLEKYGTTVAGLIASAGETVYYNTTVANVSDVTVARIHVDTINSKTNIIILDDVQVISTDVTELNKDQYFGMDFSSAGDYIELTKGSTTLISRGSTVEIIPDFLGIRVGDTQLDEPVRFYVSGGDSSPPAVTIDQVISPTDMNTQTVNGTFIETGSGMASIVVNGVTAMISGTNYSALDVPLNEGINLIQVVATDNASNMGTNVTEIMLDTIVPIAIITEPEEGVYVKGTININGTASDVNFKNYIIEWKNASDWTQIEDSTEPVSGRTLATWDTSTLEDGNYMVRLTVIDEAFRSNNTNVNVIIDNTPPAVTIDPVTSPTNMNTQTVNGTFIETGSGIASIVVNDVTSVISGTNYSASDVSLTEGINSIQVVATDNVGNVGTNVTEIMLDTIVPTAIITEPEEGAYVKGTININGTASDVNFKNYIIEWKNASDWTQIEDSTEPVSGGTLATWNTSTLEDGNYMVRLTVIDNAFRSSNTTVNVTIDNTPPAAVITEPAEWAFVKGTININGTASDVNFKNYIIEWMNSSVAWTEIQNSTEPVSGGTLATWDTSTLEDGDYTIRLTVTDNASNSNISIVNIKIDNTLPMVNMVTLNTIYPNTGDDILVTVNATDNIAVTSVIVNGTFLDHQEGDIWNGTITALAGTHFVNVSCKDAAGNIVWSNSTSYSAITGDLTFIITDSEFIVPIKGVTVSLGNIKMTTDAYGLAVFTNVAFGDYRYKIRMKGFEQTSGIVNVNGITTMEVELIPK